MDDGRTEPFEPYQPETSYDWDYEEEPPRGGAPKILWGRIIAVAVVFLVGLLIGRAFAGGGGDEGPSQSSYDALKKRVSTLEQQLAAARAAAENPPADETPAADDTATPSPEAPTGTKTYEVKPGDTLRGIAEKFYDDASLDDLIAEANGITDATQLSVGRILTIPPKP